MPRLKAAHAGYLSLHVIVFCDHDPFVHETRHLRRRMRHLPGRLARGNHHGPSLPRPELLQRTLDRLIRQHRPEALPDDLFHLRMQCVVHGDSLLFFAECRTAAFLRRSIPER